MINAEKYLKNGIRYAEFADDLAKYIMNSGRKITEKYDIYIETLYFLTEEEKSKLTDDERVILRNLHYEKGCYEYEKIRRTIPDTEGRSDLILVEKDGSRNWFNEYLHLFQFIKPRRRILY